MGWNIFPIILMVKMPFLQNGLQAHSNRTCTINTTLRPLGVCSHFVQTNCWGVHTHFVAANHFVLQNGGRNPTWYIQREILLLVVLPPPVQDTGTERIPRGDHRHVTRDHCVGFHVFVAVYFLFAKS